MSRPTLPYISPTSSVYNCKSISAPQLGWRTRVFAMGSTEERIETSERMEPSERSGLRRKPHEMARVPFQLWVNPKVLWRSPESNWMWESSGKPLTTRLTTHFPPACHTPISPMYITGCIFSEGKSLTPHSFPTCHTRCFLSCTPPASCVCAVSVPAMYGWVKRPRSIVLYGFDAESESKELRLILFLESLISPPRRPFLTYVAHPFSPYLTI